MKTISSWEFKHLRYIEYVCANTRGAFPHPPRRNGILSLRFCYLFFFFFSVVVLLSIDCLLFW